MPKAQIIKIKGVQFKSLAQACAHYGIAANTARHRMNNLGWSIEKAITTPKKDNSLIVGATLYSSLSEACLVHGVNDVTVIQRISRGWSLEEALGIENRYDNIVKCEGSVYLIENNQNSLKYVGITTSTVESRFQSHCLQAKYGVTYKLYKAMRALGIENFTVREIAKSTDRYELAQLEVQSIKKYNSIDQGYNNSAGGWCIGYKHGRHIEYMGVTFISRSSLAKHLGMTLIMLNHRLDKGLPLTQAIGSGSARKRKVLYQGKTYDSIAQLSRLIGLHEKVVYRAIDRGKPLTETHDIATFL